MREREREREREGGREKERQINKYLDFFLSSAFFVKSKYVGDSTTKIY